MGKRLAAVSPAECTLSTLGSFELRIRGKPVASPSTQKARALLAYLVMYRKTDVPRERLVDVFWPEADPDRARDSLNTALHSIRRSIRTAKLDPNDFIFANKSIVRWETAVDFDAERFEQALQTADEPSANAALAQYRGDFLEGDYDEWTVRQRERIAERYESLLAQTVRSTNAPELANKLLARNPYDEDAYAALIDAEIAGGRFFSASQVFRRCCDALGEINESPSPGFHQRYSQLERRAGRDAKLRIPFVGRDAEFAEIAQLLEPHAHDRPRVALIAGEPGIGKSALLERLGEHAAASGFRVVSLRAVLDDSRAFAFWPALYESLSGEDFATFLGRAKSELASHLASVIADRLENLTVLAIDDAQYLSGDALETLGALAKRIASERKHFLVVATRPEAVSRTIERIGETSHAAVNLSPLADIDVTNALALAGIELDTATGDMLRARAKGHPLYLKGLLEQLVRTGALRREGMHWQISQAQSEIQWPASLRRLVEARIRARGPSVALAAELLALEPSATPAEIAQAADLPEMTVLDALDDLLGYHIIIEPQSGPRQFAFTHDLIEETARILLPAARRARMHGRLAAVISESAARGRSSRCAVHYEAAGMFAEAARAYLDAAQESADAQAPHATIERTQAGLRCTSQLADSPESNVLTSRLLQGQSFAQRLLWQLDLCFESAQAATECARASGDLRCLADALVVLRSAINIAAMEREKTLRVTRELASVASLLSDRQLLVQSLIDEGHTHRIAMDLENAEPCVRRAFDVATHSGDPELIAKAAIQLISLQTTWWRFDGAAEVVAAAKAVEPVVEWPFRTHLALVIAMLWTEIERFDEAAIELQFVWDFLDRGVLTRSRPSLHAPRTEVAIRADYFQAALDGRRGTFDAGLQRFGKHLPMYESVLQEARYRDLLSEARIDLLLGRNAPGDVEAAGSALQQLTAPWNPETGFEPYHAPPVLEARVHARSGLPDARLLLERAYGAVEDELSRYPYGADAAFGRIAEAAGEIGAAQIAERAALARESLLARKRAALSNLVSV